MSYHPATHTRMRLEVDRRIKWIRNLASPSYIDWCGRADILSRLYGLELFRLAEALEPKKETR